MTNDEKLDLVRVMTGGNEDDKTIKAYLIIAGDKIIMKAYPYHPDINEVPDRYHTLQCEIACYLLNKRGAEGQMSHSENGIARTYEKGSVPASMLKAVRPHVGVIT